jgi:hypothetical protein
VDHQPTYVPVEMRHLWDVLIGDHVEEVGIVGTVTMEADNYYLCRRCLRTYHKVAGAPVPPCKIVYLQRS